MPKKSRKRRRGVKVLEIYHRGDNLEEEIYGTSIADEYILDVGILYKPNFNEQDTHGTKEHRYIEPEEKRSLGDITKKPNIKSRHLDSELQSKFFWALKDDKFEEFVELLKHSNVKLNYDYSQPKYPENGTCLEIASRLHGRSKYVEVLLEYGVAPNVNKIVFEPIHYAAKHGNPETLKILLKDKRTNVNAVDKDGRTALHQAVKNYDNVHHEEYTECIILLLNRPDFDINKPNKRGFTAIHEAAGNCKEVVQLLLKHRSQDLDLDTYRGNGRTAREHISQKYSELKNILPGIKQEKKLSSLDIQLLRSLLSHKLEKFRKNLQQIDKDGNAMVDPNVFYGNPHNATCLEIASRKDECVDFVKLLLRAGADPNTLNPITKQTPLHSALERGNHKVATEILKDKRTNVNAVNSDGKSILHIIAEWTENTGKKEYATDILKLVLKAPKLKVNLKDKCGKTAAEIALANENKDFLEIILTEKGTHMDLDVVLQPDNQVLREAIRRKYPDLQEKFPTQRYNATDDLITILFDHLYNSKADEFVNALQKKDESTDINADDGNYTLLQYAVLHGLEEPVRQLLIADADPNKTTKNERRPPIIIASQRKNQRVLRILLETKSTIKLDVNATDIAGNTALHYASKNKDLDSVLGLLRSGAKVLHRNLFGKPHLSAESIKFFLDGSLKTNNRFPDDEHFELIFDYNFLLAYRENQPKILPLGDHNLPLMGDLEANRRNAMKSETFYPETDFLHYISKSYEYRKIMEHPIVNSFFHIKWLQVRTAFIISILIHLVFVLFVNGCIIRWIDNNDVTVGIFDDIALCFLWMFLVYFGILEIFHFSPSPEVYIKTPQNILDLALICSTGVLAVVNKMETSLVVIVILVSWSKLMLMTSRVHKLSSNITMLKQVIVNYFWLLFSFTYMLIAFGLSFYAVYHAAVKEEQQRINNGTQNDDKLQFYSTAPLSIIKTVIMMVGEFEANDLLTHIKEDWVGFVLFILFIFMIPMVLLNLLTGVAVSDAQSIKEKDHILCLVSRIELIYYLERNLLFLYKLAEKLKLQSPKLAQPFLHLFKVMLKRISLFSGTLPDQQHIRIRPNTFQNAIIDHKGHKTRSKLELKILRKSLEIISDHHEQTFADTCSLTGTEHH